jgi:hypothetical protein
MMRKSLAIGVAAAVVLTIAGWSVWAEDDDEDNINPALLAKALSEASVSWSEDSRPASAKASQSRANLNSRTARFSCRCTR